MVYVIHLESKIGRCQHYIGYTCDIERRFGEHRSGNNGSPLLREANRRGVPYTVATLIEGDRTLEKRLKKSKNAKKYCCICNPDIADLPFI